MNIIIPLGGVGSRFAAEGYTRPKPLIRVLGKEMIRWVLDSLDLQPADQVIIVYLPQFLGRDFERIVLEHHPAVRFVQLKEQTRGAAETVLFGLKALNLWQRRRPVMLVDGDTFYTSDVVAQFRSVAPSSGAVFCFQAPHDKPIFSYVKRDRDDVITDIKEKEMISCWANTGAYCFQSGRELAKYIQIMLDTNATQRGEFYTSGVIQLMLEAGRRFVALEVDVERDFHVLGTPEQVEGFARTWPARAAKRWCFDLDNTLVTHPSIAGDYTSCRPIPHMIQVVRELHAAGHHIIIHTARRMRTHGGNVSAVVADVGQITLESLRRFGIPYDEICFGKPYAHFYVDDLAVDPLSTAQTVAKQTGFHDLFIPTLASSGGALLQRAKPPSRTTKPWHCRHEVAVAALAASTVLGFAAGAAAASRCEGNGSPSLRAALRAVPGRLLTSVAALSARSVALLGPATWSLVASKAAA